MKIIYLAKEKTFQQYKKTLTNFYSNISFFIPYNNLLQ